jgi:hypothetical protein
MNSKMKFRSRGPAGRAVLAWLCVVLFSIMPISGALAAEDDTDLARRVELARGIVEILPSRPQIEQAVDEYVTTSLAGYSDKDRETFRRAMLNVINPRSLDKAAVDAYAGTYTAAELAAMLEYYSKPEARSALARQAEFEGRIRPEILRMLDQAVLRIRSVSNP